MKFKVKAKLNFHLKKVHKRHFCPVAECSVTFADANGLKRHNFVYHMRKRNNFCSMCEFSCRDAENRLNHYRKKHKDLKRCRLCYLQFGSWIAIEKHFDEEHSEEPYQCSNCRKSFGSKDHKNRHQKGCTS